MKEIKKKKKIRICSLHKVFKKKKQQQLHGLFNKVKTKKYHTVGTVPKQNRGKRQN
jgi:hypothetical protein